MSKYTDGQSNYLGTVTELKIAQSAAKTLKNAVKRATRNVQRLCREAVGPSGRRHAFKPKQKAPHGG